MIAGAPDRPRVLIVEDDPNLRDLWVVVLEDLGCAVTAFADGADACRAIATFRPQLILLDLVMPEAELDGFDVLARLGESGAPVIVVSALGESLGGALGARVAAVLSKPLDIYVLIREVNRLLASTVPPAT